MNVVLCDVFNLSVCLSMPMIYPFYGLNMERLFMHVTNKLLAIFEKRYVLVGSPSMTKLSPNTTTQPGEIVGKTNGPCFKDKNKCY